jgi:hypothetical protein
LADGREEKTWPRLAHFMNRISFSGPRNRRPRCGQGLRVRILLPPAASPLRTRAEPQRHSGSSDTAPSVCGGRCFRMVEVAVDLHDHHDSVLIDDEIRFDPIVLYPAPQDDGQRAKGIPSFLRAS